MRKIKYILGLLILLVNFTTIIAQPTFQWVNTMGSSNNDFGKEIVTDAASNSYIIGEFQNTVDFDPGPGITNLTSLGSSDVFLQKLDKNGNLIWIKQFGGTNTDQVSTLVLDGNGDLIMAGQFKGISDFDPGPGTNNLTATGIYSDTYIAKLDTNNGNLTWVQQIDATHHCFAVDMNVNSTNEILLTGRWYGTADFDPGVGTSNLTAAGAGWDAYILKLSSSGTFVWVKQITCTDNMYNQAIGVDLNDNVLLTGYYYATIDVDPGPGTVNFTGSMIQEEMFIVKLNNNGIYVWAQNFTSPVTEMAYSIYVDANNDYYFGGWFSSALDFDTGPGNTTLTTNGGPDCFLMKLNSSGALQWVNQVGGTGGDEIISITGDNQGNILVTGRFQTTVDFDPGTGIDNFTSAGGSDVFIQKISPSGAYFWTVVMGGTGNEYPNSIAAGTSGEILTTGNFIGTVDFDPGTPILNNTSAGANDVYVHKLRECVQSSATISPTACGSYASPSGNYTWTTSNTYSDTIPNFIGCDSIITVNLTILPIANGTDVITACDSYTWIDNNTYTTSNNTATHTITNGAANGCDSIVTLNLTINNTATGTDAITACDSHTWIDNNTYTASNNTATHTIVNGATNGCDSIVTLNLTINNTTTGTDVISACNSYTWIDNNTYTSSNSTATHTIVNGAANGCDSVVTLNLTINTVDNTTSTQGNDNITANATGATYQWLDCNNNYAIIPGATNQLFVTAANGSYAVEVTQNGCTDTSACITITGVGIDDRSIENTITIFPNPSNGLFTIKTLNNKNQTINLLVINTLGKVINEMSFTNKAELNLTEQAKGIYYLQLSTDNHTFVKKIVIK